MRFELGQRLIDAVRTKVTLEMLPVLKRDFIKPIHTYKRPVCITGFSYTGSGALIDLLSEYENVTSVAFNDEESGKNVQGQEVDFFREIGGVFDLEKLFDSYEPYRNSFTINLFILTMEYLYKKGGIYNDEYVRLTNEFLSKIIDFECETKKIYGVQRDLVKTRVKDKKYKNLRTPFIKIDGVKPTFFYRKDLTKEEYRLIAKEYIKNVLNTIESKEILILDQFFSNGIANVDLYRNYLDDFKWAVVYRDPRDRYVFGKTFNKGEMPTDYKLFVKWYKMLVTPYTKINDPDFKMFRFEDFIYKYDSTVADVEKFIGLDSNQHTMKFKYLVPEKSVQNIGLYKNYEDKEAISYIEENLGEFCFYNND